MGTGKWDLDDCKKIFSSELENRSFSQTFDSYQCMAFSPSSPAKPWGQAAFWKALYFPCFPLSRCMRSIVTLLSLSEIANLAQDYETHRKTTWEEQFFFLLIIYCTMSDEDLLIKRKKWVLTVQRFRRPATWKDAQTQTLTKCQGHIYSSWPSLTSILFCFWQLLS